MRHWHRLPPVKRVTTPTRLIVVCACPRIQPIPVGTGMEVHTLASWSAVVCYLSSGSLVDQTSAAGVTADGWWDWLDRVRSRRSTTWVYSPHMGYALTLLEFWDRLAGGFSTLGSAVLADPPTVISTRWGGRRVIYADVRNYWRSATARSGDSPASSEICASDADAGADGARRDGDVDISHVARLLAGLAGWLHRERVGPWAATAAGIAWGAYRHGFMPANVYLHGHPHALRLERACFFGGRLSAPVRGAVRDSVTATDVNSLYPAAQLGYQYPNKFVSWTERARPSDVRSAVGQYVCCAQVEISGGAGYYPVRGGNGVTYSCSAGVRFLCGEELRLASEREQITSVYQLSVYEPADLFSSWVRYLYPRKCQARAEGNHQQESVIKLLLNSLYGKFGQRGRTWRRDAQTPAQDDYAWWWVVRQDRVRPIRYRSLARRVEYEDAGEEPRNSFPGVAACVTANGRVMLDAYWRSAGSSNVLYCDTDSLHLLPDGYHRLHSQGEIDEDRLGAMRVVYRGSDAEYWGPKHYRVGDRLVLGSVSGSATPCAGGTWCQTNLRRLQQTLESGRYRSVLGTERRIRVPALSGDDTGHAREEITNEPAAT